MVATTYKWTTNKYHQAIESGIFLDQPVELLRGDIIVIIDKKPYNWNTSFFEINNNSPLGQKILKTLMELSII